MPKVTDYVITPEINDIMEDIVEAYPQVFEGFDSAKIGATITANKKGKRPVRISSVRYPVNIWCNKVYIVEAFQDQWVTMDQKQKNLAVFHVMCAVPEGGFDENSKNYGRKKKPDYEVFMEEFAVTGGVPNWMENPAARDPIEVAGEIQDDIGPSPVAMVEEIDSIGIDEED